MHIGKHLSISVDIRATCDDCDADEYVAQWPIMLDDPVAEEHIHLTVGQARDLLRYLGQIGVGSSGVTEWETQGGPANFDCQTLFVENGRVYLDEAGYQLALGTIAEALQFAGYIRGALDWLKRHPNCWALRNAANRRRCA